MTSQDEFAVEGFDAKAYASDLFSSKSVRKAQAHRQQLSQLQADASDRLITHVTDNYKHFVTTSRHIGALEGDVADLSRCMRDFGHVLDRLQPIANAVPAPPAPSSPSPPPQPPPPLDANAGEAGHGGASSPHSRQEEAVQRLEELEVEMDESMAQRDWERVLHWLEEGLTTLKDDESMLSRRVHRHWNRKWNQRRSHVVTALSTLLKTSSLHRSQWQRLLGLMHRLGYGVIAFDYWLADRAHHLSQLARGLNTEVNEVQYVNTFCVEFFAFVVSVHEDIRAIAAKQTMASTTSSSPASPAPSPSASPSQSLLSITQSSPTSKTEQQSRGESAHLGRLSSLFMVWLTHQLRRVLMAQFERHVFRKKGSTYDWSLIRQTTQFALSRCRLLEQRIGLSVITWLTRAFRSHVASAIQASVSALQEGNKRRVMMESWSQHAVNVATLLPGVTCGGDGGGGDTVAVKHKPMSEPSVVRLSMCTFQAIARIVTLVKHCCLVFDVVLLGVITSTFPLCVEHFVSLITDTLTNTPCTDEQATAMLSDVEFVCKYVLPWIGQTFQRLSAEDGYPSMLAGWLPLLEEQGDAMLSGASTSFAESRAMEENIANDALASKRAKAVITRVRNIGRNLSSVLEGGAAVAKSVTHQLWLATAATMLQQGEFWDGFEREVTFGGLQQLLLDVQYLVAASAKWSSEECTSMFMRLVNRALTAFCSLRKVAPEEAVKPDTWFSERVAASMERKKRSSKRDGK